MTLPRTAHTTFLVGAERSGTTLLRLMLDGHPQVSFHPEFNYVTDRIEHPERLPEFGPFVDYLRSHRIFQETKFRIDPAIDDYVTLVRSFLPQWQGSHPLVGATVHHGFEHLPRLWPDARYIHLVRDPRDVARSAIGMGWVGNVWVGAEFWIKAERAWDLLKPQLREDQFVTVRYESLLEDAPTHLKRITDLMGIDYDDAMLSYPERSTYKAPNPALAQQWKTKLDAEQLGLVEARVGELLTQRGYEPSGAPAVVVDDAKRKQLLKQSQRFHRQHRIKRFGIPLLTLNKLAKVLPSRRFRAFTQNRIYQIQRQYIK